MEFRALRDCNAVYLLVEGVPGCDEFVQRPESPRLWLQNMLNNEPRPHVYGGQILIGRKPSCHICLKDRAISSVHGTLSWQLEHSECPSTASERRRSRRRVSEDSLEDSAPLIREGDRLVLSLYYMDQSTNGSFEEAKPIPRSTKYPITEPRFLTVTGKHNSLDPVIALDQMKTNRCVIHLGKPQSDEYPPVFAFSISIGITDAFTRAPLTHLTSEHVLALEHVSALGLFSANGDITNCCFIGCPKDPRLQRVKTEGNNPGVGSRATTISTYDGPAEVLSNQAAETAANADVQQQLSALRKELFEKDKMLKDKDRIMNDRINEQSMELKLLEKKLVNLQKVNKTLLTEKEKVCAELQNNVDNFERTELKRQQIQVTLDEARAKIGSLENEKYKLSLLSSQYESKTTVLEKQVAELQGQYNDLQAQLNLKGQKLASLARSSKQLANENENLRQSFKQIVLKYNKVLSASIKLEQDRHSKIVKSLGNLLSQVNNDIDSAPSTARRNSSAPQFAVEESPVVPMSAFPVIHDETQETERPGEDEETCSATEEDENQDQTTQTQPGVDAEEASEDPVPDEDTFAKDLLPTQHKSLDEEMAEADLKHDDPDDGAPTDNENDNENYFVRPDAKKRRRKDSASDAPLLMSPTNAEKFFVPDSQFPS